MYKLYERTAKLLLSPFIAIPFEFIHQLTIIPGLLCKAFATVAFSLALHWYRPLEQTTISSDTKLEEITDGEDASPTHINEENNVYSTSITQL